MSGYRILIIDDEPDLLELCVDAFEMEGHSAVGCPGGSEALEKLSNEKFDVIISDSKMPGMSGEEVFQAVKKNFGEAQMPLFFLSTGEIDIDEESLVSRGMSGLISKPYEISDLISAIEVKLSSTAA